MGSEWIMQLLPMVFTRIKNGVTEKTKAKYNMGNDNFSTVGANKRPPAFPFVYVKMMTAAEKGRDLEATTINGGLFTFQVDVTDNSSQDVAKNVMNEIVQTMKRMSFEIVAMPDFESTKESHRCTARFRRAIDKNDIL